MFPRVNKDDGQTGVVVMEPAETVDSLTAKIAAHALRLKSEPDLAPRVKKRIFQKIGKLKTELTAMGSTYVEPTEGVSHTGSGNSGETEVSDESGEPPAKKSKSDVSDGQGDQALAATASDGQPSDTTPKTVVLSKKENKAFVHFVVKQLSEFAQKKQLAKAKQLIKQQVKKGLQLDVHCYSNLLNVYVRCNDMAGAWRVFTDMKKAEVSPNIVAYTTLLKGYSELGKYPQAIALYEEMIACGQHNIRSLSTFLRGCQRTGSVHAALTVFQRSTSLLSSSATLISDEGEGERWQDCAVIESIVSLLCRALRLEEAAEVVLGYLQSQTRNGGLWALESAGLYILLARTCALLGLVDEARKHLSLAHGAMQNSAHSDLTERMRAKFAAQEGGSSGAPKGKEKSESTALFQAHKREQLQDALEEVEDYVAALVGAQTAVSMPATALAHVARNCFEQMLGQFLWFGFDGKGDLKTSASTSGKAASPGAQLAAALREKAGLLAESVQTHVGRCVDEEGRLQYDAIFADDPAPAQTDPDAPPPPPAPVYLEVGAGHGDWAAAQAAYHREAGRRGRWMAAELRFDRSHDILCRHFLSLRPCVSAVTKSPTAGNNLAVLGGDAHQIVSQRIPHGSLAGVFCNYPQPPERSGAASQGQHLLTPAFLSAVHAVLATGGCLTLLTDNMNYALQLARSLVEDMPKHRFRNSKLVESAECMIQEVFKGAYTTVTVYRGQPGADCGHCVNEHSYFDRLWAHGQKRRRWFFCVEKCDD